MNLFRLGYRVMWTIRFLFGLLILLGIVAILIAAGSIMLIAFAVVFICAAIGIGWASLQAWLKTKAKERDLANRCR